MRLQTQIQERQAPMPLRKRIGEIFKKYGVMVTSILLGAVITIRAVIGVINKGLGKIGDGLKYTCETIGNGLKDIGKKVGSILPGLIGSIVSFLFKSAGQAIGFIAEHTWLLILHYRSDVR